MARGGEYTEESSLPLKVLFQGDSITDGNRGRSEDPNHILGHGFVFSIASRLGANYPERKLEFVNRGVSGDTVVKLAARWNSDALQLKPDLISILIGVNDVLASIGNQSQISAASFTDTYVKILDDTKTALPSTTLVLCEPFALPVGMVAKDADAWNRNLSIVQAATKDLAATFKAVYVPFQDVFIKACKRADASYWIWDGIHPTYAGHGLMADQWLSVVGSYASQLKF